MYLERTAMSAARRKGYKNLLEVFVTFDGQLYKKKYKINTGFQNK